MCLAHINLPKKKRKKRERKKQRKGKKGKKAESYNRKIIAMLEHSYRGYFSILRIYEFFYVETLLFLCSLVFLFVFFCFFFFLFYCQRSPKPFRCSRDKKKYKVKTLKYWQPAVDSNDAIF